MSLRRAAAIAEPLHAQAQRRLVARPHALGHQGGEALAAEGEQAARFHRAGQQVGLSDEARGKARGRPFIDFLGRTDLLETPVMHDGDAVGHVQRLFLVVGNINKGNAQLFLQRLQLGLHLAAKLQIQRAQRLVQQQDVRREHHGPRDGHALALASGQAVRHAAFIPLQLHQAQHFFHPAANLRLGGFSDPQAIGDVGRYIHMRKEGVILKHGVYAAAFRRQRSHVAAVQPYAPAVRRFQPRDNSKRGRLSTAAGPQQREEFARLHIQINPAQHIAFAKVLMNPFQAQYAHGLSVRFSFRCRKIVDFFRQV